MGIKQIFINQGTINKKEGVYQVHILAADLERGKWYQ